jgi:hypothetical protein
MVAGMKFRPDFVAAYLGVRRVHPFLKLFHV